MNIVGFPYAYSKDSGILQRQAFSFMNSSFLYWVTLAPTILFNAAFVGFPMFIISVPFVIYQMIDVIKNTSSWNTYFLNVMK